MGGDYGRKEIVLVSMCCFAVTDTASWRDVPSLALSSRLVSVLFSPQA